MALNRSGDDAQAALFLRPDYYEFFPLFSTREIAERVQALPFHLATLLDPENIVPALATEAGRRGARAFFTADRAAQRTWLREVLLATGISPRVAGAIGRVPRELFVPAAYLPYCYLNQALSFDSLSCLTPPGLVALMLDRLDLHPGQTALEVGIGSGYHAACAAESAGNDCAIYGVELSRAYAAFGQGAVARAAYPNIRIACADGYLGWPAPLQFDRIYLTASFADTPPSALTAQLREGGIFQGVRAITATEYDGIAETSWLRRWYPSYEAYRAGRWRGYSCLFTARKEAGQLVEIDHIYDVRLTPLHQNPDAYRGAPGRRFAEIEQLLQSLDADRGGAPPHPADPGADPATS
jgi:protein-L-isoaspartate(D-aspartate) O-methyltransferase